MEWWRVNRIHAGELRRSLLAGRGENVSADISRIMDDGYEYEGASECGALVLYTFRAAWDGVDVRASTPEEAFSSWDAMADRGEVA